MQFQFWFISSYSPVCFIVVQVEVLSPCSSLNTFLTVCFCVVLVKKFPGSSCVTLLDEKFTSANHTDIVWAHSINNPFSNQPVFWSRKCAYNVKLYLFQQSLRRRIWSHKSWFPLKLPCIVCTHRLTDKMFALNSISFCTALYDFYIWQNDMEGKRSQRI